MNSEKFSKEEQSKFFSKEEIQDAFLFSMDRRDLAAESGMLRLLNNQMALDGIDKILFSDLSRQEIEIIKRILELKMEEE